MSLDKVSEKWQQAEFIPRDYLDMFFSGQVLAPNNKFSLENLHKWFKDGELTGTMIDVGCGPTIHCLISASAYCDSIVCSDYTPANRTEVKKWLNQDPTIDFDWLPFFEYAAEIEKKRTVPEMQDDMRRKVTDVIHCDVRNRDVIQSSCDKQFDIVLSVLCLDDATNNKEDYFKCLHNVIGLLKPSGTLLLMVATCCPFYTIGMSHRESANVSREDVLNFLTGLEFEIVDTSFMEYEVTEDMPSISGGFLFVRTHRR